MFWYYIFETNWDFSELLKGSYTPKVTTLSWYGDGHGYIVFSFKLPMFFKVDGWLPADAITLYQWSCWSFETLRNALVTVNKKNTPDEKLLKIFPDELIIPPYLVKWE